MTTLAHLPLAMSRLDINTRNYSKSNKMNMRAYLHITVSIIHYWLRPTKNLNKFVEEEISCTSLYWQLAKHFLQTFLISPYWPNDRTQVFVRFALASFLKLEALSVFVCSRWAEPINCKLFESLLSQFSSRVLKYPLFCTLNLLNFTPQMNCTISPCFSCIWVWCWLLWSSSPAVSPTSKRPRALESWTPSRKWCHRWAHVLSVFSVSSRKPVESINRPWSRA